MKVERRAPGPAYAIMYKPTWAFGENIRSIYVLDREGATIKIRMASGAYSLKMLRQVVIELTNLTSGSGARE